MSDSLGISRRFFLKAGSAAAIVLATGGFRMVAYANENGAANSSADIFAGWVEITPDNQVHILFPSTEMGQGSNTALPQILADELNADWEQVVVKQLNEDDRRYGNPAFGNILYTAGSSGVYAYFEPLKLAGAHLREMLRQRAANEWQVDVASVTSENNLIVHKGTSKKMSYGDIIALPDFANTELTIPVTLKQSADYTLIGKPVPRMDIPDKTTGKAMFAIDVRVPNMLYAQVVRSPVEGETVASINDAKAKAVKDIVDVVVLPDGVAVIAKTMHASQKGRDLLDITWTTTSPFRKFSSSDTLDQYKNAARSEQTGADWKIVGDVKSVLNQSTRKIDAMYTSDYAYHAQLEPMACVASVDEDGKGAEIWVGTQTQSWTTHTAKTVLNTTQDRIKLNMMQMGGGFGRRTELMQNYVRDALLCSKTAKKPVKVVWSRTDDIKHGAFRPAAAQYMQAGFNKENAMTGFYHRVATPSVIEYFNPIRWAQVKPNDIISMRGAESKFYTIDNFMAEHIVTERHARVLPWRGIGAAYTSFASEAFVDEVAASANQTPYDFRMELLKDNPSGKALLEKVSDMAAKTPLTDGRGRGIAFAGYGDTQSAGIVEISLNESSGAINVHHVWIAVDAGKIISPDNAHNQIEGGVLWGVSAALYERITITNGEVDQDNFFNYPILRQNAAPNIDVFIAQNEEKPKQVGEAGNPMVAPAIANAFFNLTGKRIRHLPFTSDHVKVALG